MSHSHGKHCAPPKRYFARLLAVSTIATLPALLVNTSAQAAPASRWDAIISCESGNQNINNSTYPASSASGYLQILDGTWRRFGGQEFASRAIDATKEQQLIVADRIAAANPSLSDWNPSRGCWGGKIGASVPRHASGQEAPKPAKATTPRHAATYTVVSGDNLSEIAAHHGSTWQAIYGANRDVVHAPDRILTGQSLTIP